MFNVSSIIFNTELKSCTFVFIHIFDNCFVLLTVSPSWSILLHRSFDSSPEKKKKKFLVVLMKQNIFEIIPSSKISWSSEMKIRETCNLALYCLKRALIIQLLLSWTINESTKSEQYFSEF